MEDLRVLGLEMSRVVEAEAGDGCGGCCSSSSSIIINSCSSIELSGHVSLFSFLPFGCGVGVCVSVSVSERGVQVV